MFSRVGLVARHLARPSLSFSPASTSASAPASALCQRAVVNGVMSSSASANERNSRTINTAACLIIGDEVLGGKTVDTNSAFMAKWCFSLGIQFKRVEVIADDESEIIEAVRRMSDRYDFVVTRHDDITYASIAKAFDLPIVLHQGAFERMKKLSKPHSSQPKFSWDEDSPARTARLRMVQLPTDATRDLEKQFIFPKEKLWVPVAVVNGNVHILPGVPRLFEELLEGLKPNVIPRLTDPEGKGITRIMISTPLAESEVADYLTELAARVEPNGVKVGSYPRWGKKKNTVTLVGRDQALLESLVPEVAENVKGRRIQEEGEDDDPPEETSEKTSENSPERISEKTD